MPHMDKHYDQELQNLREKTLKMGGMVEKMIIKSMDALLNRNSALAEEMIEFDHEVNGIEVEIDEECIRLLVLRQPMASDLRFITTAQKISTELERVSDLGVNICERCMELNKEEVLTSFFILPRMSQVALEMIKKSLDSFVGKNVPLALEVCKQDDEVDGFNEELFRMLYTYMIENPNTITRATRFMFVSKYLERIADHATNIAELVIYMVKGKNIRHTTAAKKGEME